MNAKIYGPVLGLLFCCASVQAYGACDPISPNPNPAGNIVVNTSSTGCTEGVNYENHGLLNNAGSITGDKKLLNEGIVINSGSISHAGLVNDGLIGNSGSLQMLGLHEIQNSSTGAIVNSGRMGTSTNIVNEGLVVNSGFVSKRLDILFNNGTWINSGSFQNGASGHATILNTGVFINTGDVFNGGDGGTYYQSAGVTLADGTMSQEYVRIDGGVLHGTGTITAVGESLDSSEPYVRIGGGTINPGAIGQSIGTLSIDGDLTFNSGILMTEIAGSALNDLLKVTDTASFLAGTFAFSFLNGYLPGVGDSWTFLEAAGGITGWENLALAYSGVPSNYLFSVSERDNSLVLSVAAVPEPEVYASMILGLAFLGFLSKRRIIGTGVRS